MTALFTRGLALTLLTFSVAAGGCSSSGDDDAASNAGTGAGGGNATGGTGGMSTSGSVATCGFCATAADCASSFCNVVNAALGACTAPGDLTCKLSDSQTLRGLSGKALSVTELPAPGVLGDVMTVDADDPGIRYSGRIDFTSNPKAPRFSAPGVTIKANFHGTQAAVLLNDQFRYGRRNYFDAIIDEDRVDADGNPLSISVKLGPTDGQTRYVVLSGLPEGDHSITLVKRTESSIGYTDFLGFEFDGPILAAPAAPARKIQIIGDSINCGVGDDLPAHSAVEDIASTYCMEDTWGVPYHDAYLAFGLDTARFFQAEYQVAAVSGIGLVRDYSSKSTDDTRPLPEVYDSLFLEDTDSPKWNPKDFVPGAVLIALGTNDFSPGDNPSSAPRARMTVDEFVSAYVDFLDKLMSDDYYPDAQFFVLGSPMLGDGYPDATYTYRTDLETAIAQVEAHYAGQGNVHAVKLEKTFGKGCGTHPDAGEQAKVAVDDVEPAVASVMGW